MDACATLATEGQGESLYSRQNRLFGAKFALGIFCKGNEVTGTQTAMAACAMGAPKKHARRISHRSRARYARVRFLEGR